MATALSRLALLQPRSLAEALRLLRDEGPLVPLAGCTDLYVGLHFGTVPRAALPRPPGPARAARHPPARRHARDRRARDLRRADRVAARAAPAADPGRGLALGRQPADPEPRHAGRQRRQRLARRRHAAGPGRGRGHGRPAQRGRRAPRALRRLLHGLPADGDAPRRADRRDRGARRSRAASGSARSAPAPPRPSRRS